MTYPLLTDSEYAKLTENAKLVKRTRTKIRLLLSQDNNIIKHIYKRKLLSSSTIWPYITRFIKNAKYLKSKNISVPNVHAAYFYPTLNCYILIYDYVEQPTLHNIAKNDDFSFFPKLAKFITELHAMGVFFKDIHLDNIIMNDNEFTLLDLESLQYQRRPLTLRQRARNLAHLFNRKEDILFYQKFGWSNFLDHYFDAIYSTPKYQTKLKALISPKLPPELV